VEDSYLTASVLIAYSVGMFFYLGRDVLVRVFYALEDATTPFRISVVNIFLNALLDYLLVGPFGAPGIILATVGVNVISTIAMLWILNHRLQGLPIREWSLLSGGLALASAIAGLTAWGTLRWTESLWGTEGLGILLLQLLAAGLAGFVVFCLFVVQLRLPEVTQLGDRLRQKLLRR